MDGFFGLDHSDIEEDGTIYTNLKIVNFSKNGAKSFPEFFPIII